MLETTRNGEEDADGVLFRIAVVAEPDPGSGGEDNDDKGVTQHRDEEHGSGGARVTSGKPATEPLDPVEEDKGRQTESCIDVCLGQCLESVDDDLVGSVSVGVDAVETKQLWHLTCGDLNSGTRHETSNGRSRNELDDETKTKKTNSKTDDTAQEGKCAGDHFSAPFVGLTHDVVNNVEGLKRHDSDGTNGDILGGGEDGVDHDADEGRVETELGFETGKLGIRHGLRNDDKSYCDAGNKITNEPLRIVRAKPLSEGEEAVKVVGGLAARVTKDAAEPITTADHGNAKTVCFGVVVSKSPLDGIGASLAKRRLLLEMRL